MTPIDNLSRNIIYGSVQISAATLEGVRGCVRSLFCYKASALLALGGLTSKAPKQSSADI